MEKDCWPRSRLRWCSWQSAGGLARKFAREDAEHAEAARAAIEAHAARSAASRREQLAKIAAREAAEEPERQRQRAARAAQLEQDRARAAVATAFRESPRQRALQYVNDHAWKELDSLIDSLAASGKRTPDGDFELQSATSAIAGSFNYRDQAKDRALLESAAAYRRAHPESAFAPLLPAMQLRGAAWRARGGGYSSSVPKEGWRLFSERSREAWQKIMAARARSERLPTWYEQAIQIGVDAAVDERELEALFEEGILRHPEFYPIRAAMARRFSPRWGGNYAAADAFVRTQAAAANSEGDALYTRLYLTVDSYSGQELEFFDKSRVDWTRMRTGFDSLFAKYPTPSNRAVFAIYACRAADGATYMKLRREIDASTWEEYAPAGVSLEVCDERFLQRV